MKYQKIVKAFDMLLYLIEKQGISYIGTQETDADSNNLKNPGNFLSHCSASYDCYLLLAFPI